jgi:hypothetical protein
MNIIQIHNNVMLRLNVGNILQNTVNPTEHYYESE